MIRKEYRDDKAVKTAVNGLNNKDFVITGLTDGDEEASPIDQSDAEE